MIRKLFFLLCFPLMLSAQDSLLLVLDSLPPRQQKLGFFQRAEKPDPWRIGILSGSLALGYSATSYGLAKAWYADYKQAPFHSFDDWYEWRQYDKLGHLMTTYFEANWVFQMYRWAGVKENKAAWIGFGAAMLFQGTVELMDGFSADWGWSWGDIGFNSLGAAAFLSQQLIWKEQRIRFKISAHKPKYSQNPIQALNSTETTTLQQRADDLFGSSIPEMFFKEYNGGTIWASVNIGSFIKNRPKWVLPYVNIALGYGIENVFGAERNKWYNSSLSVFEVPQGYQRQSQFFLSLDIDFERIPTKSKALKTLFSLLNVIKIPFPALEINSLGQFKFHPFYF